MPKKKSRKRIPLLRPEEEEEKKHKGSLTGNPDKMSKEEEEEKGYLENQNPKMIQEEEDEERNLLNQNPRSTEEEEEDVKLENQNSGLILQAANLENLNPTETNEGGEEQKNEDEDLQIQNSEQKTLEVESIAEDVNLVPGETGSGSPKMMEEEELQQSETLDLDQDPPSQDHQKEQKEKKPEIDEPEGMAISPDSLSNFPPPPGYDLHMPDLNPLSPKGDDQQPEGVPVSPTISLPTEHDSPVRELALENPPHTVPRKGKNRKKPLNKKQRTALENKIQKVKQNMRPIPFVPTKILDFSKHEKLFKSLGLWEFAHIEFDREIRFDLLASLIATYNSTSRGATVNGIKILVNRADLARALKLPMKKDKNNPSDAIDFDNEKLSDDSISFIEEFVSNWILLHEDIWAMPNEVLTWTKYIKEGQPQKVDWPGLIWFMVEKELVQGQKSVPSSCYYASHLQYLMRSQKSDLFRGEARVVEVLTEEGEDNADTKMKSLEDFQVSELENQDVVLTLGQDRNESEQQVRDEEDVMDFEDCKETGVSSHWVLDGKNNIDDHCLRRCNSNKVDILEDHDVKEEEDELEERFDLSSKCATLERLPSTDLLQAMGTTSNPYSPSMQVLDNSTAELLQTRANNNLNLGGTSMFGNACKRELSHEDDVRRHSFNDHNKRMRNNSSWDQRGSEFDMFVDQISSVMDKAKTMYVEKEEAVITAQINQNYLMSELQQRDNIIANLQRTKCEEIQKRDIEIYKLDHELRMMSSLVEGYRKAMKEAQQVFSEYRKRNPEPEEPLYKDVPGSGGLVLSVAALEKQRLEREEEEKIQRCYIEEKLEEFQGGWFEKLEMNMKKVHLMDERLLELNEEVKLLKEISAKHKMSETREMSGTLEMSESQEISGTQKMSGTQDISETQVCSLKEEV